MLNNTLATPCKTLGTALTLLIAVSCGTSNTPVSQSSAVVFSQALPGTWARVQLLTSEASALGTKSKTKVARYSLVTFANNGDEIVASEKVCEIATANSGSSSISFAPSILKAIPDSSYSYLPNAQGTALARPAAVEALGLALKDPAVGALPTSASDSRVIDQDNDGNPGVTVNVEAKVVITISAELYVAQRTFWSESLTNITADTINGSVNWTQEQTILGSSNSLFTTVKPKVTTLPAESSVTLRKLSAGAGCADVIAQKTKLFGALKI
ncbi:MAG: hypothetical protein EOP10_28125 [Proteobacteria bacterium]|nr:MAG: hypothetical protein EOP10_28125 [Pseudomonadota bacterium]